MCVCLCVWECVFNLKLILDCFEDCRHWFPANCDATYLCIGQGRAANCCQIERQAIYSPLVIAATQRHRYRHTHRYKNYKYSWSGAWVRCACIVWHKILYLLNRFSKLAKCAKVIERFAQSRANEEEKKGGGGQANAAELEPVGQQKGDH